MNWKLATHEDVVEVASNLRQGDIDEAQAMYGIDAGVYLPRSYDPSRTWVFFNDQGHNFGLAGVAPTGDPNLGQVWMVSTPDLYKNKTVFLRKCGAFIDMLNELHPILFNWVDARQTDHLKWLKWQGFIATSKKLSWGAAGIPFYEMVRIK